MRGPRLRLAAIMLAAAGLVVACTPAPSEVTFFGNRTAVQAEPAVWCSVNLGTLSGSCPEPDSSKAVALSLRPGDPVEISVPFDVAQAPWVVVFRYIDGAGKEQEARTAFFTDHRLAYVLRPPTDRDLIIQVEVQAMLVPMSDGSFQPTRIWVLTCAPAGAKS